VRVCAPVEAPSLPVPPPPSVAALFLLPAGPLRANPRPEVSMMHGETFVFAF